MQKKREYKKEANLDTTAGKYFLAKQKTKTKKEAAELIGYNPANVNHLEATKTYQAIEKKYFRDVMLEKITLEDIAREQIKVITQDKDLGAKNTAIKNTLERIEPETNPQEEERVVVILRGQ